MRQRWFARRLTDTEMVIDTPGRVIVFRHREPPVDEPAELREPEPFAAPLLSVGQEHRAPALGWHR